EPTDIKNGQVSSEDSSAQEQRRRRAGRASNDPREIRRRQLAESQVAEASLANSVSDQSMTNSATREEIKTNEEAPPASTLDIVIKPLHGAGQEAEPSHPPA
ncbi:MAG TPA: hypothetical protein VFV48_02830, partial [Pseudomonadales bacterium]|nr:hypothetical protein [Pseudomonadales bacterium]